MDDSGVVTPDGCAVEVYLHLPENGEPDLIDRVVPVGSRILELGCGTGRLANVLAARGHDVVGVDESAAMISHLQGVTPVCARIERLHLGRTFDAVVLAAHLLSTVDLEQRRLFLNTCERHLARDGILVAQWFPPSWFDGLVRAGRRSGTLGAVRGTLEVVRDDGEVLSARTVYEMGDRSWSQVFQAHRVTEDRLGAELIAAGLSLDRWLDDAHGWFAAARRRSGPASLP
ncbi:class I SAM-dependent methyltransferase [Actinoplanes oblitus]|uniref:Class I SAM-dependent methyltransferase n=1 Tax=Actinoplanes oblitus TaxID=3040509 RepID=A0ABY8WVQ0_9ACTN|nr:class I SAM-dependent methyltransferase [Actinoplanes oblitus]WIN00620.1 class I SAM-dependent methyltransferase [Actinoplanes oblitus]